MGYPGWFHELAARVNNWGRWGPDDQMGTLNLLDEKARLRGAACVQSGRAFSLGIPLSAAEGVQMGLIPGRINPLRTMVSVNKPDFGDPPTFCRRNDVGVMAPHRRPRGWPSAFVLLSALPPPPGDRLQDLQAARRARRLQAS